MSEVNKKCGKCNFKAPLDEWDDSPRGGKFYLCVKCREYNHNYFKNNDEIRLKRNECLRLKYQTNEVFRNAVLNRYALNPCSDWEVLYVICDFCGKGMRQSSLRPHLICCKGKSSPELAMLKKLSDLL